MGCLGHSIEEPKGDNYILAEFEIKGDAFEEEQLIYNPVNNVVHEGEEGEEGQEGQGGENKEEKKEVRECEIEVNGQVIPFDGYYKFPKVGTYQIKYTFKTPLTDAASLFFYCTYLKKADLTHLQGHKITSLRNFFTSCELLQSVDFSNLNLQNVTDMRDMFQGCVSLKNINFNCKTKNLEDISGMFGNCVFLIKY